MKRYFLFAGINLNLNITKKEPEKCMFHGWIFEKKGLWIFKCWGLVVVCPIPIKISGYAPAPGLHSAKFSPMAQNDNYATGLKTVQILSEQCMRFFPVRNKEMWIKWKLIVRETCFCEKILADFTVSRVFQKYFNFVPMLESRNVGHMKGNCLWDIILWKNLWRTLQFHELYKNISTLYPC